MAKLKKTMCKVVKDGFKTEKEAILEEVRHPQYICKKCLRVASDKTLLCDPKKINSEGGEKKKDGKKKGN